MAAAAYLPLLQVEQEEAPSELTLPEAHAAHAVVLEEYLPAGQLSQVTEPEDVAMVPPPQVLHED